MWPYILLFAVVIIGGLFVPLREQNVFSSSAHKARLYYCVICGGMIITVCGLRATCIGADTEGYANINASKLNISFSDLVDSYVNPDIEQNQSKDLFFKMIYSFYGKLFTHHQGLFFFFSVLSFWGPSWIIYRYSKNPTLSFLFLLTFMFTFALSGIRQACAIGITCFAYKYICERKLIPFVATIICASLFHKSAFLFLPVYYLNFNVNKRVIIAYIAFIVFVYIFPQAIVIVLRLFENTDARIGAAINNKDDLLNESSLIIHATICGFCWIHYRSIIKDDPNSRFLFNITAIGVAFMVLVTRQMSIFFRFALYFTPFEILLVPACISAIKNNKMKQIYYLIIGLCCVGYFFQGIKGTVYYPFKFFWNN